MGELASKGCAEKPRPSLLIVLSHGKTAFLRTATGLDRLGVNMDQTWLIGGQMEFLTIRWCQKLSTAMNLVHKYVKP
jgi:hypothetical protein